MRPANTIEIGLKDHSMMLIDAEGHQLKELSEYFSFFVPGHRYMPAFKRKVWDGKISCLLYTSPSPRDQRGSRMPASA